MKKFLLVLFTLLRILPQVSHAFYDPTTGSWISRDPLGEAGGVNLYTFCHNDPVNFVDPDGLTPMPVYKDRVWSQSTLLGKMFTAAWEFPGLFHPGDPESASRVFAQRFGHGAAYAKAELGALADNNIVAAPFALVGYMGISIFTAPVHLFNAPASLGEMEDTLSVGWYRLDVAVGGAVVGIGENLHAQGTGFWASPSFSEAFSFGGSAFEAYMMTRGGLQSAEWMAAKLPPLRFAPIRQPFMVGQTVGSVNPSMAGMFRPEMMAEYGLHYLRNIFQKHHPTFKTFMRAYAANGWPGFRDKLGRLTRQQLSKLELELHDGLIQGVHPQWNQFVTAKGFHN